MPLRIWMLPAVLLVLGGCASPSPELDSLWDDFQEARKPPGLDDAHLAAFVARCCVVADQLDDHDFRFTALLYAVDACSGGRRTYAEARRLRAEVVRRIVPLVAEDSERCEVFLGYMSRVGRSTPEEAALEGAEFRGHLDALSAATASETMKTDVAVAKDQIAAMRTGLTTHGVGAEAVEIEGADLDGVAFKLSDYRGKVVMLDFWGYW